MRTFPFLLLATYGMFLCSYFLFPDYSDPYRFFARVLFLPGIFVFVVSIRAIRSQALFYAIAAYMLYLLLSGFWSEPIDWYRHGQKLTISVYLLSFITITRYLINWNPELYARMLQVAVLIAALAALVSLVLFYRDHAFPGVRLEATGSLTNINEFANLYGVFAILAMVFALRTKSLTKKVLFLCAIALFTCIAWFGQSRTAFVSLTLSLLVLVHLTLTERRALYITLVVALAGGLILAFPDLFELAWFRGEGLRPQIWAGVWTEALSAPVFGHSLVSQIYLEIDGLHFRTAHNAFLQVFWNGGVVGLCLFLALLVIVFRNAWAWGRRTGDYSVFCLLLFATCTMMTGVDTLIERPRDQWMSFWLPVALLLSYQSLPLRPQQHGPARYVHQ